MTSLMTLSTESGSLTSPKWPVTRGTLETTPVSMECLDGNPRDLLLGAWVLVLELLHENLGLLLSFVLCGQRLAQSQANEC